MKVRFFDLARKLAKKSQYNHKLGAVIVKKNRILGLGFNNPKKTHPKSPNKFGTIHAELAAILNSDSEELEGSSIYIYRETCQGLALSRPCSDCEKLLRTVGISTVYYTSESGYKELEL